MTLHNAKGLEYDAVFIIGCEEGVFPHSRSLEEGNEEEERRLCYVGITRARKRLWLTHARSRRCSAGRETGFPSRFLSELPDELVEREGTAGAGDHRLVARREHGPDPEVRPVARPSPPATTSSTPASATGWSRRSSRAG